MEQERNDAKQARAKVESDKVTLVKEMTATKAEAEKLRKDLAALQLVSEEQSKRLGVVDNHVSGVLGKKDEDMDAYRKQVLTLEKELKARDEKIAELQTKIIDLSREVQEKDMELEFYQATHEETKNELIKTQSQKLPMTGGSQ